MLTPLSWVVTAVARRRARAIRKGPGSSATPVIVVGNLVVGGAGKTPATIAIVRGLRARGMSVGVLCGSYRASDPGPNWVTAESDAARVGDEAVLLARRTGVPVVSARDRGAALELLRARSSPDLVISDDGLQHPGLPRWIELAVFDSRGAGNGRVLPAGPLREPLTRARAADALLLNGTDAAPIEHDRRFSFEVRARGCRALPGTGPHDGQPCAGDDGLVPVERFRQWLGERRALAIAGIAQPGRFHRTLEHCGIAFEAMSLPDHVGGDVLAAALAGAAGRVAIVTEKDAVKLAHSAGPAGWCLIVDAEFGDDFFNWLLERIGGQTTARDPGVSDLQGIARVRSRGAGVDLPP